MAAPTRRAAPVIRTAFPSSGAALFSMAATCALRVDRFVLLRARRVLGGMGADYERIRRTLNAAVDDGRGRSAFRASSAAHSRLYRSGGRMDSVRRVHGARALRAGPR